MKQKELTKGQGYWKEIEKREKEMNDGVTE